MFEDFRDNDQETPEDNAPTRTSQYGEIDYYFKSIRKNRIIKGVEEQELAKQKTPESEQKLVTSHLRFVVGVAMEYRTYGFPIKDLIQAGNEGMTRAAKKFQPDRGCSFIGYAVWWIRAYIQEFIISNWSMIKIGTSQTNRSLFNRYFSRNKKPLSALAEKHNKSLEKIAELEQQMLRRITKRELSLNSPTTNNPEDSQKQELQDIISDNDENTDPEASIVNAEAKVIIQEVMANAIASLKERERFVLEKRMQEPPEKLATLGEKLNISKERVRQIENTAKKHIAQYIQALGEETNSKILHALRE